MSKALAAETKSRLLVALLWYVSACLLAPGDLATEGGPFLV